jgi:hypothetical protein
VRPAEAFPPDLASARRDRHVGRNKAGRRRQSGFSHRGPSLSVERAGVKGVKTVFTHAAAL